MDEDVEIEESEGKYGARANQPTSSFNCRQRPSPASHPSLTDHPETLSRIALRINRCIQDAGSWIIDIFARNIARNHRRTERHR